jgi:hypothetical protein
MDADIHRQLGANQQAITTLTEEVHQLRQQVQQLSTMIAEARGGWSVLLSIGGMGAAIGGAITAAANKYFGA